ncbi:MAG: hypothetical protein B7X48_06790 [Acidiphilium sp. 34-60-192]|nr:MAG: hypothetical protein B7X48_06790 [Acidiphilium sp. 34-60-192]
MVASSLLRHPRRTPAARLDGDNRNLGILPGDKTRHAQQGKPKSVALLMAQKCVPMSTRFE